VPPTTPTTPPEEAVIDEHTVVVGPDSDLPKVTDDLGAEGRDFGTSSSVQPIQNGQSKKARRWKIATAIVAIISIIVVKLMLERI
jgi:hypothetical protein